MRTYHCVATWSVFCSQTESRFNLHSTMNPGHTSNSRPAARLAKRKWNTTGLQVDLPGRVTVAIARATLRIYSPPSKQQPDRAKIRRRFDRVYLHRILHATILRRVCPCVHMDVHIATSGTLQVLTREGSGEAYGDLTARSGSEKLAGSRQLPVRAATVSGQAVRRVALALTEQSKLATGFELKHWQAAWH